MQIKISKNGILKTISLILISGFIFGLGFFFNNYYSKIYLAGELLNPFVDSGELINKPLLTYSIKNLQARQYDNNPIILEKVIAEENTYTTFLFSYTTLNKKMTGQINIPDSITANPEQKNNLVVMIRGYVPSAIYTTGMGTKNAAGVFANDGYITIAPDFFGYGGSDPEPEDSWQTRFEKPIVVIELIKSLENNGISLNLESNRTKNTIDLDTAKINNIGIWAHSNGGQIALTTLEVLQKPIPTTLWAPVTAPFPYSVAYFSDELEDEGKAQRKWISIFEKEYDVFDFSLTKHLDNLTGPIQIQHGDADDAALVYWSKEFVDKVEDENNRRTSVLEDLEDIKVKNKSLESSESATILGGVDSDINQGSKILDPVNINLITYPDTNHNMVPSWSKAVQKDLQFFNKWL